MTTLFGRAFALQVADLVLDDFDCRFRVDKTLKPEPNSALVEMWNLHPDTRAYISGLVASPGAAKKSGSTAKPKGLIPVVLKAGYDDPGPDLIFAGDLLTVDHERDGSEWVTAIGSGSGARKFRTARISQALGPGTPIVAALKSILSALGLGSGNATKVAAQIKAASGATVFPRGIVLTGSAARRLTDLCLSCGLEWSYQDGAVQLLARNTVLPGQSVKLTPTSGLIGSPTVDPDGVLKAQALLVPGLKCGATVVVESAHVKGGWRVEKLSANGDTRGQDWYWTIEGRRY